MLNQSIACQDGSFRESSDPSASDVVAISALGPDTQPYGQAVLGQASRESCKRFAGRSRHVV